jgi:hypothetical protein
MSELQLQGQTAGPQLREPLTGRPKLSLGGPLRRFDLAFLQITVGCMPRTPSQPLMIAAHITIYSPPIFALAGPG